MARSWEIQQLHSFLLLLHSSLRTEIPQQAEERIIQKKNLLNKCSKSTAAKNSVSANKQTK